MGFFSALAKIAGVGAKLLPIPGAGFIGDAVGAAGDALGAASQASSSNRAARLEAELAAEQLNEQRKMNTLAAEAPRPQR